jgi:stage III sporulation protein SpoIIIAA
MPPKSGREIVDDIDHLLEVLPPEIHAAIVGRPGRGQLLEIILDLGRRPEVRYVGE